MIRFALNHMVAPSLTLDRLFALANHLGVEGVEIRNDLPGTAILDGTPPGSVRALAERHGVRLLTINALQRFNDWTPERERETRELAAYARACGAAALVLVPVNDATWQPPSPGRPAALRTALKALAGVLAGEGLTGLVEPLGFEGCSLRLKGEAVAAIDELGLSDRFKLMHDTFHHHLSGEQALFPGRTGLVHVSGVEDQSLPLDRVRDAHRVLVGPADLLGTLSQIKALQAGGYAGPFSFEPFAASVHASADIEGDLRASIAHIEAGNARLLLRPGTDRVELGPTA